MKYNVPTIVWFGRFSANHRFYPHSIAGVKENAKKRGLGFEGRVKVLRQKGTATGAQAPVALRVNPDRGLFHPLTDRLKHGLLVGKSAGVQLRVDQFPVHRQFETTATRGDQLQFLDALLEFRKQFGRQTDGLRFVVSHRAVFEFNVHDCLLHQTCPGDIGSLMSL